MEILISVYITSIEIKFHSGEFLLVRNNISFVRVSSFANGFVFVVVFTCERFIQTSCCVYFVISLKRLTYKRYLLKLSCE